MSNNESENKLISFVDKDDEKKEKCVEVDKKETNGAKPCSSNSLNDSKPKSTQKFLEFNQLDKYKSFLLNKLETKPTKPSDTLSRVREFLPMLKESTAKLLDEFKENPDELNIENVGDDDEHIEMALAFVPEESNSSNDSDEDEEDSESSEESDFEEDEEDLSEGKEEEGGENDNKRKIEEENSNSSSEALDQIGLGFIKYKSKAKLKLTANDNKKFKKNLIQVIENDEKNAENKNENNVTS